MSISYPYPLSFFADVLPYGEIRGPVLRTFEEKSGSADSRFWSARMADPLWTAEATFPATLTAAQAREIEAKIDALDGMQRLFLFAPPQYLGPASGVRTGLGAVTVSGIRTDRGAIGLSALPANFVLSAGDYLSISYAGGRVYFGRFAEGGTASGAGVMGQRELRPYLPLSIANGATVELVKPHFRAMVENYTPFGTISGGPRQPYGRDFTAQGASMSILQKP